MADKGRCPLGSGTRTSRPGAPGRPHPPAPAHMAMADKGRYRSGSGRAAATRGSGGGLGPPPDQFLPLSHRDGRGGWGVRADPADPAARCGCRFRTDTSPCHGRNVRLSGGRPGPPPDPRVAAARRFRSQRRRPHDRDTPTCRLHNHAGPPRPSSGLAAALLAPSRRCAMHAAMSCAVRRVLPLPARLSRRQRRSASGTRRRRVGHVQADVPLVGVRVAARREGVRGRSNATPTVPRPSASPTRPARRGRRRRPGRRRCRCPAAG